MKLWEQWVTFGDLLKRTRLKFQSIVDTGLTQTTYLAFQKEDCHWHCQKLSTLCTFHFRGTMQLATRQSCQYCLLRKLKHLWAQRQPETDGNGRILSLSHTHTHIPTHTPKHLCASALSTEAVTYDSTFIRKNVAITKHAWKYCYPFRVEVNSPHLNNSSDFETALLLTNEQNNLFLPKSTSTPGRLYHMIWGFQDMKARPATISREHTKSEIIPLLSPRQKLVWSLTSIRQKLFKNTTNKNSPNSLTKKMGNTSKCFFSLRPISHLYFTAPFWTPTNQYMTNVPFTQQDNRICSHSVGTPL